MTGTLFGYHVSILIDIGATKHYVDPKIVAKIPVRVTFMVEPWIIKYGNMVECRVAQFLFCSELELPSF